MKLFLKENKKAYYLPNLWRENNFLKPKEGKNKTKKRQTS